MLARSRQRVFGLTTEQYERMVEAQAGLCAICMLPETARTNGGEGVRQLSVDHDHRTGRVRKLLCNRCNTAIGSLGDDPQLALGAHLYLLTAAA